MPDRVRHDSRTLDSQAFFNQFYQEVVEWEWLSSHDGRGYKPLPQIAPVDRGVDSCLMIKVRPKGANLIFERTLSACSGYCGCIPAEA